MHVDQVIVGASVGDAVTESAIRLRDVLRRVLPSNLYAFHRSKDADSHIGMLEHYPRPEDRSDSDIIIYHVSIGDPRITDFLLHRRERLVLIYHNITPSSFFRGVDDEFANLLDAGRRELPVLLDRAEAVIADSEFNADELRALGCDSVIVAPPALNLSRLSDIASDEVFTQRIAESLHGPVALFVGQVLPHKRPDMLIAAHHLLVTNDQPDAKLVVAGPMRNVRYRKAIERFVEDLALDSVWLTGAISDAELAALYRRADLFVTASEHEGFCVPAIEAFHFDVPVLLRDFGAIKSTVGDAALVLPADTGARHLAEAMDRVLRQPLLANTLVERGRIRRERFTIEQTTAGLVDAVRLVLAKAQRVAP